MKSNNLILSIATSFFFIIIPFPGYSANIKAPLPQQKNSDNLIVKQLSTDNLSGQFVAVEKSTAGTVRIITEGGHRYLELDANFTVSNQGPDLHVLLDQDTKPNKNYQNLGRTVNLGKLKSFTGIQRYSIPDVINLAQFKSVVIWCRTANATFGYASLNPAKN
jgi:hypothetical protein